MGLNVLKSKLLAGAMALTGVAFATSALAQTAAPAAAPADAPVATAADKTTTMDVIIVVANRYQAAAAQMKATNTINVLSAEDLSHTAVHNVAEALALLPGISTTNTGTGFIGGVDAASRGEAMYAQVRGMDTSYAINLMNGVNVAEANPYTRSVQLNLLPPSGLSTIVVNLTATPDQESDFVSGLVDYHTPSAFDFGPEHFAATLGGKLESESLAYGSNKVGDNVSLEGSKRFGSDQQFGVYVGAYYDTRYFINGKVGGINESQGGDYGWGYAIQGGGSQNNNSAPGLIPINNLQLAGINESAAVGQTERYGGSISLDWRPNDTTSFYARMTSARADTIDNVANTQIVGQGNLNGQNGKGEGSQGIPIGTTGNYELLVPDVSERYWFITNPQVDTLGTGQVGGESRFGHLTVSGNVFYSTGKDNMPDQIQVATRNQDNGGAGTTFGGSQLFSYNSQGYPLNLLSAYQQGVLNNIPGMPAGQAPERTVYLSQETLSGAKADFKYDFDGGFLKYVKFGFKLLDAWHESSSVDYQAAGATNGGNEPSSYANFASLGLISNIFPHVIPGLYSQPVPNLNTNAIEKLYYSQAANPAIGAVADDCGSLYPNNYLCNTTKTREEYDSAYVMGDLKFGDLEVIPGIRFENTVIHNTYFLIPNDVNGNAQVGHFATDQATETVWLPSIYFNYRPTSRSVYRFGVWDSYIRPPFNELGGGATQSVTVQTLPNGGSQTVTKIQEGNPNLKPVTSTNVDLSGEWTSSIGGHLMATVYYKALKDYIYDAGDNAGNYVATSTGIAQYSIPVNGGRASVLGFDFEVRQKFQGLPKPFDGLGVWGNFTRQYTGVNLGNSSGTYSYKDAIANTPGVLGNAGVFYQKGPISIDLNYNYQGAAVQSYDWFGMGSSVDDVWTKAVGRVDMHVGYEVVKNVKVDVAVSNLTNATTYFAHVGKNNDAISDIVFSGVTGGFNLTYKY
jgi:TonB-dependent receptor